MKEIPVYGSRLADHGRRMRTVDVLACDVKWRVITKDERERDLTKRVFELVFTGA